MRPHVMKLVPLVVLILAVTGSCGSAHREILFYVAPDGSDGAAGTDEGHPFATLDRARDAVRSLKRAGKIDRPVTVYVRGGVYELTAPMLFTPEDSGTPDCPVTYRAYPGETPVISGGSLLGADWQPFEGDIMVSDLPMVEEGWRFRQLFLNGARQQRAREPNDAFYTIAETDAEVGKQGMRYKEGNFRAWDNLADVEVVVYHYWNESRCRVASLDEGAQLVKFTGNVGGRGIGRTDYKNRYYIENAREFIDKPGEWYLDIRAGKLYFLPPDGADLTTLRAPRISELLRLQGDRENGSYVEYLAFEGLTFCDVDWNLPAEGYPSCGDVGDIVPPSAITFDGAANCTFANNTIRNVGTYALEITGHDNSVTGNHIHDTGSGGIITRSYSGGRNQITYNHIHHCGNVYVSAVGVNVDDGGGYIAHNLVHDITHSGIYGRHWATTTQELERRNQQQGLIIEFNEIHDCMHDMNDGAGIFIRDSDIFINNNLIYDIWTSPVGHGSFGTGFYLGCETRNTVVKNNVIFRTEGGQLIWFSNRNILVTNNIMVDCGRRWGQIYFSNPSDRRHEYVRIFRNIFAYQNPDWVFFPFAHDRCVPVESDNNILWNPGKKFTITGVTGVKDLKDWKRKGLDMHSVVADPLFVDPTNDDYSLKPDSPAFDLGFEPIDLSTVGLRGRR